MALPTPDRWFGKRSDSRRSAPRGLPGPADSLNRNDDNTPSGSRRNPRESCYARSDEREACVDDLRDAVHARFVGMAEVTHVVELVPVHPGACLTVRVDERW